MSNDESVLHEAVCETFANMAFLDLMPSHQAIGRQHEPCVSVDVFEPVTCRLAIAVPPELLDEIAISATGGTLEGAEFDSAKHDLLLEVANVVAGSFASRIKQSETPVELGLPRLEAPPAGLTWQRFETESGWVDVSLEMKDTP